MISSPIDIVNCKMKDVCRYAHILAKDIFNPDQRYNFIDNFMNIFDDYVNSKIVAKNDILFSIAQDWNTQTQNFRLVLSSSYITIESNEFIEMVGIYIYTAFIISGSYNDCLHLITDKGSYMYSGNISWCIK